MNIKERQDIINNIRGRLSDKELHVKDKNELEILEQSLNALGCIDQYMWERDVALGQLKELGLSFAENTDKVKVLIYRDKEEEAIYKHENGTFVCPSCNASTFSLTLYGGDFCQHCGKRVKWRGLIK